LSGLGPSGYPRGLQFPSRVLASDLLERISGCTGIEEVRRDVGVEPEVLDLDSQLV
jgi:hypothetical protein